MRIRTIELNNYRLYKGVNSISFPTENGKNLFLVSGENGFGKTTFLQSLLWCLYGRLMAEVDDAFRKEIANSGNYNSFVADNLNKDCKQLLLSEVSEQTLSQIKKTGYSVDLEYLKKYSNYSVSLEFSDVFIPSIPCQSLKITRSYDIIKGVESVDILIDGIPNELSNEIGADIFINDFIISKDIARFFFFDSEKIVTLAETNTIDEKRRLSSAYNEVLGVKKYEDLKKNLENLRLRFRRKSTDVQGRNRLNALLAKQEILTVTIAEQEAQTSLFNNELLLLRKEDEVLQMQLLREGNGTTLDELNRQEIVLKTTQRKNEEYKQKMKLFLEFAPFAISGKLFKEAKEQLERDFRALQSKDDVRNQNELLTSISQEMKEALNNISIPVKDKKSVIDCFHNILLKYQSSSTIDNNLLNVSKEDVNEFLAVYTHIITTYRVEFEHLADDYRKNKQILERTTRNISNMQNKESDSLIKKIRKQKNESEEKIIFLEEKIKLAHEERGSINKELAVVNRQISELSKKVSLDDNDLKKDKVAEQLISELNTFLVSLKKEKKFSLEKRIKATMNNLMHKTDFIGSVEVSVIEDLIDINLYSTDHNIIKKETLSKGEQQLYATSLLKALVEESGIQFPVFIDSPLQKFDKSHAKRIITEFYPTVSEQVVLFPLLHKELTYAELEMMMPLVKSVYKIKNEGTRSYIQTIDINDLMKD